MQVIYRNLSEFPVTYSIQILTKYNKLFHKITQIKHNDVQQFVKLCEGGFEMLIPAQRRRDILKLIEANGSGTITELSRKYGVSEMTIRRDLKSLEESG